MGLGVRDGDRFVQVAVGLLEKQGIKPAGNMMISIKVHGDVNEFTFQVEIPVDQEPKNSART